MDREKVIKGLEWILEDDRFGFGQHWLENIEDDPPQSEEEFAGLYIERAIALLKEQQEQIDRLIEENASNAEMAEGLKELLKEQEAVVRCKDCVECYFASNRIQSEQTFACGKHGIDVAPDWFCADGIAKDINVPNKEGQ